MKNSKKNKRIIIGLCLVVVVLLLGGFALQKANARGLTLSELLFPKGSAGTTVIKEELTNPLLTFTEVPTKSADEMLATDLPNDNGQSIQARAIELVKKADEAYLKPGWLHISSIIEGFPTKEQLYTNGDPIPTKSTSDAWYLLGENGFVTQAVDIDDTGDPSTTQTSVYQDGYWNNLTVPEASVTDKNKQIITLDMGLLNTDPARNFSFSLEKETEEAIVITRTESFAEPVLYADIPEKIKGVVFKYTVSKESGQTLMFDYYVIYQDDTLVILQRITNVVEENVSSAPDEILSFFESR